MNLDAPKNANYAAVVVRVNNLVDLPGLDNLVGAPVLGHQALTQRSIGVGDLRIAFTAETQLSPDFCYNNNLYRDATLNADEGETGYLEANRRIRALKLRGHRSDALLMPLESVAFAGINPGELQEGDTFDTLNGHAICQKYEIPVKQGSSPAKSKVEKAFKRVDSKLFPEHLDTDAYWRSKHLLRPGREVVVTQKLHGTSIRIGRVPCLRQKGWLERQLNRWFPTTDHTYDAVFGSRKVIKDVNNPNQNHYYATDIWTEYGSKVADMVPEGYMVYGELIGWTSGSAISDQGKSLGTSSPIQANYTYDVPRGQAELYVYRVATINAQGTLADLPWDGVKEFCQARGLKWTPELARLTPDRVDEWLDAAADAVFHDDWSIGDEDTFVEEPVRLSSSKTVDEGVCLRQEGIVPTILKAKSAVFLQHETKLLDKGEVDLESAA
ncbi:hypothetical protein [Mycobacterium phage WXIN]|nr:hypothetical protein [Mycobacterium phage WXIN]